MHFITRSYRIHAIAIMAVVAGCANQLPSTTKPTATQLEVPRTDWSEKWPTRASYSPSYMTAADEVALEIRFFMRTKLLFHVHKPQSYEQFGDHHEMAVRLIEGHMSDGYVKEMLSPRYAQILTIPGCEAAAALLRVARETGAGGFEEALKQKPELADLTGINEALLKEKNITNLGLLFMREVAQKVENSVTASMAE